MGFLDKVTKGITDTVDGISKAVSDAPATTTGAPPAATGHAPQGFTVQNEIVLAEAPQDWLTPAELEGVICFDGAVMSAFVAAPDAFERDGAMVARFVSTDGSFTVDVASLTPELIAEFESMESLQEELRADLISYSFETAGDFDLAVSGSTGDGHGRFVGFLGDLVGQVDIYGPPGASYIDPAHNVLYEALHLYEM